LKSALAVVKDCVEATCRKTDQLQVTLSYFLHPKIILYTYYLGQGGYVFIGVR